MDLFVYWLLHMVSVEGLHYTSSSFVTQVAPIRIILLQFPITGHTIRPLPNGTEYDL
jgi:hypothetical protein